MYARNVAHTKFMCRYTEEHIRWKYCEEGWMLLGWNTNIYKLCIYVCLCAHTAHILYSLAFKKLSKVNPKLVHTRRELERVQMQLYMACVLWAWTWTWYTCFDFIQFLSFSSSHFRVLSICSLVWMWYSVKYGIYACSYIRCIVYWTLWNESVPFFRACAVNWWKKYNSWIRV